MSYQEQKVYKIFLNNMHTWFSNFLIEELRTDHIPKDKIQYSFMGTKEPSEPLPYLFGFIFGIIFFKIFPFII